MHRLRTALARLRPLTAKGLSQPRPAGVGPRTLQPTGRLDTSVAAEPFLNGTSSNYVEEMYYAWLENPRNVHKSWDIFFRNANAGALPGAAYQSPEPKLSGASQGPASVQGLVGVQPNVEKLVEDHLAVQSLIRAYQVRGHHIANLDPLDISCVDFDDAPCTFGFQNVGEKHELLSRVLPEDPAHGPSLHPVGPDPLGSTRQQAHRHGPNVIIGGTGNRNLTRNEGDAAETSFSWFRAGSLW